MEEYSPLLIKALFVIKLKNKIFLWFSYLKLNVIGILNGTLTGNPFV